MTDRPHPWEDVSARPFSELRDSGLLWLINTTVLHPRGFGLALHYPHLNATEPDGWVLNGDGTEAWVFEDGADLQKAFADAQALLRPRDPQ
jgi:hypothetical protein